MDTFGARPFRCAHEPAGFATLFPAKMRPRITVVIPTRERGVYLRHSLRTCVQERYDNLEILVLDNSSADDTPSVVQSIGDGRVRHCRSETRLSMRNNFERGLSLASGDVVCFIGDDDGLFPGALDRVADLFENTEVDAVSATRAHYFWPDYAAKRKNTALLPRKSAVRMLDSKLHLRTILSHCDFYTLPCLYHGFVRKHAIDSVRQSQAQGRFFLSSIVDVYSSIALSSLGLNYAFSEAPLIINGASKRSNGVAHFSQGRPSEEKLRWNSEDDLGFLPGFDGSLTLGALILESAIRFCGESRSSTLIELINPVDISQTIVRERQCRIAVGRDDVDVSIEALCRSAGVDVPSASPKIRPIPRALTLARAFARARPVLFAEPEVGNIASAAALLASLSSSGQLGMLSDLPSQLRAAFRLAG